MQLKSTSKSLVNPLRADFLDQTVTVKRLCVLCYNVKVTVAVFECIIDGV